MDREAALTLLQEYTKNPGLIKHAMAVEAAMGAYAARFNEDVNKWRIVGLVHDLDYEQYPDMKLHAKMAAEILQQKGYPDDIVYAVHAHNEYHGLPQKSLLDKTLYAVDELCGFIVAVALVRPNKSIAEVDVNSVKKKMKNTAFARQVDREAIYKGAETLGVELDEHIRIVLTAMQQIAAELGL